MEHALEVENLVKCYGEKRAVDGISFSVDEGALFALLGVNGAGKSTTINMICSILKKDAGRIEVSGHDLDREPFLVKREIGVVFQTSVLDAELTVLQNLILRTAFYAYPKAERRARVKEISSLLALEELLDRPIKTLSGGQRRRVDIARAMVHRPRLLILDEPTTGLDPKTRLSFWTLIDELRKSTGMTVFLTTHYLEEADKASDVVILDKGKIIAHGTPNALKNAYSSDKLFCYRERSNALEEAFLRDGVDFRYLSERACYCILLKDGEEAKRLFMRFSSELSDIEILKGNLDDVFLNVTGKNLALEAESDEG